MEVSISKAKSMMIAKKPIRYILEVEGKMIEQTSDQTFPVMES